MPSGDLPLGGEPPTASRFLFEVDGIEIGVFREVTGLAVTVGVQEIREGGQNGFVHKMPDRMTWPNLVFRRGVLSRLRLSPARYFGRLCSNCRQDCKHHCL